VASKPNGKKPNGANGKPRSKPEAKPKQTGSKTAGQQRSGSGRNAKGRFTKGNPTAFKPGQSGNPKGAKPRVSLVDAIHRRLIRAKAMADQGIPYRDEDGDIQRPPTVEELADGLLDMALKGDREALGALNTLLDRTDGKPIQGVEHTGKDGDPIEIRSTRDDVLGRIARIAATSATRSGDREPN
jgi:hypothetical protein